ncbi:hypothetical protein ACFFGH_34280 [Lysobacter korlensis]|uniref:Uncharacterized protein n=1 Tax=Lysobacter korlensis TaxID=553636 RepID=A0ABV6S117_9GAMM
MTRDRFILALLVSTWPVAGLVEPLAPSYRQQPIHNEVALVHMLVLALLLFAWCKAHASVHGVKPPVASPLLVALFAPVGLAYYFFRAFTWRRALRSMASAVLVFVVCGALYAGGLLAGSQLAA